MDGLGLAPAGKRASPPRAAHLVVPTLHRASSSSTKGVRRSEGIFPARVRAWAALSHLFPAGDHRWSRAAFPRGFKYLLFPTPDTLGATPSGPRWAWSEGAGGARAARRGGGQAWSAKFSGEAEELWPGCLLGKGLLSGTEFLCWQNRSAAIQSERGG